MTSSSASRTRSNSHAIIRSVSTETIERPRQAGPGEGLGGEWRVIVRNDNHNTFDHVARTLAGVLPNTTLDQGHAIAEQIHNTGQAIVWTGPRETAEHYWQQLDSAGLHDGAAGAVVVVTRSAKAAAGGLLVVAALLAASSAAPAAQMPSGFRDSVVLSEVAEPTAIDFAADGHVFVALKTGRVLVYDGIEDQTPTVFADLRGDVYDQGDRGLAGLAVDPDFPERPYVYVLYTYDHILGDPAPPPRWGAPNTEGDPCPEPKGADTCLVSGRLLRLTSDAAVDHAIAQKPLVEEWCQQFSSHSSDNLEFGADGALYASGGDGASFNTADYGQLGTPPNPCGDPAGEGGALRAQDLRTGGDPSRSRWDPDPDRSQHRRRPVRQPPVRQLRPERPAYRRLRVPQPLQVRDRPRRRRCVSGQRRLERLRGDRPPPRGPWPALQLRLALLRRPRAYAQLLESRTAHLREPRRRPRRLLAAVLPLSARQSRHPRRRCRTDLGSALSGITFYEGGDYPAAYDGALFFADSVRGCIFVMFPGQDGRPDPTTTTDFSTEAGIYPGVDLTIGPGGDLFYVKLYGSTEAGTIHRISYDPDAPVAHLAADPLWGEDEPLEVHLDASGSTDPQEEELTFAWDLDEDGVFEHRGQFRVRAAAGLEDAVFIEVPGEGEFFFLWVGRSAGVEVDFQRLVFAPEGIGGQVGDRGIGVVADSVGSSRLG